jgi:hypothetical protein
MVPAIVPPLPRAFGGGGGGGGGDGVGKEQKNVG